jgi:hypothetical protein
MADLVVIVLPGVGTLELSRAAYEAALRPIEATRAKASPEPSQPVGGLLDAKALATALSLPVSWVREKARQGEIPCTRAGRYVRFDLASVRKVLTATDQQSFGRR